jgi:hypothetical protein
MKSQPERWKNITERELYLNTRTDIRSTFSETDLWAKVITKAIDDIVTYLVFRNNTIENTKEYTEQQVKTNQEIEFLAIEASHFLFSDDYCFPFEDYTVEIECLSCENKIQLDMSSLAKNKIFCSCGLQFNPDNISYTIISTNKTICLQELISLWDIDNITQFRNKLKKEITKKYNRKIR